MAQMMQSSHSVSPASAHGLKTVGFFIRFDKK